MKKELVLFGQECLDAVKEAQSLDVTRQRLKFMTNKIGNGTVNLGKGNRTFNYSKMWINDDKVYYASDVYTVFMSASGKIFTRSHNVQGFTYEPLNKHALKLWGNTKLSAIDSEVISELLMNTGAEWALECNNDYGYHMLKRLYTHKGLFQRILKGRITNAEDLVRAWLKVDTRWRELKISHRAKSVLTLMRRNISMDELIDFLSIVSNVEATLDGLLNGKKMGQWNAKDSDGKVLRDENGNWKREWDFDWFVINDQTQYDIRKELVILDKKINSTWSANRLMAEHTEMSRQVLDMEVEDMKFEDHGYQTPCPVLPGMELIQDNIRLYSEGRTMNHCIYSYLDRAQRRDVVHFHCTFGEAPFSLAVEYSNYHKKWVLQQMFGRFNSNCTDDQRAIVGHWLYEDAVQQWLDNERGVVSKPELDKPQLEDFGFDYDPLPF